MDLPIAEDFLYFVWSHSLFHPQVKTVEGDDLIVKYVGSRNEFSGPDFFNSKVKIGDTIWSGNVEIHVKSSDWNRHKHSQDEAYSNVILHVVYEHDVDIPFLLEKGIPTFELKTCIPRNILGRYLQFQKANSFIPCEAMLHQTPEIVFASWKERLLIERLQQKSNEVELDLHETNNDWDEVSYRQLARGFGFKANKEAFLQLARRVPLKVLRKYSDHQIRHDAILLGASGLLKQNGHPYVNSLVQEWLHCSKLHGIDPLPRHIWKTSGVRPANFPALRVAQFSAMVGQKGSSLISEFIDRKTISELKTFFDFNLDSYWNDHFGFEVKSTLNKFVNLGQSSAELILINTVAPLLFQFGLYSGNIDLQEKSLDFLCDLKPESNGLVRKWKRMGVSVANAADSQSLLQLYVNYCSPKKCLFCGIGNHLIKK